MHKLSCYVFIEKFKVFCTMLFGALIARLETITWVSKFSLCNTLVRKISNKCNKVCQVCCVVSGLFAFMHDDSKSSAVFQPNGTFMLNMFLISVG